MDNYPEGMTIEEMAEMDVKQVYDYDYEMNLFGDDPEYNDRVTWEIVTVVEDAEKDDNE